jgi:hypothetical protein
MNEVLDLLQQRFHVGQVRRNHVARTITQLEFAIILWPFEINAPVINLDFVAEFGVVIHDHASGTDNAGATHLLRRKPTDLAGSDNAAGKFQPQESNIALIILHTRTSEGGAPYGHFVQPVKQDRDIMDCQIPYNVYILLEQSQVHARKADVVNLSKFSALDEFSHFPDRRTVDECVASQQRFTAAMGHGDQLARKVTLVSQRLLYHDVLACFQCAAGYLIMG